MKYSLLFKILSASLILSYVSNDLFGQCEEKTDYWTNQWESCEKTTNPNPARPTSFWIQFDFEEAVPISTTQIWNANKVNKSGWGGKTVFFDISTDGTTWQQVGNSAFSWPQAPETEDYEGFQGPDLRSYGFIKAILITYVETHSAANCAALAEVRFNVDADACDGVIDECGVCNGSGAQTFYFDADGDGLGNSAISITDCTPPSADYVANDQDDCDTGGWPQIQQIFMDNGCTGCHNSGPSPSSGLNLTTYEGFITGGNKCGSNITADNNLVGIITITGYDACGGPTSGMSMNDRVGGNMNESEIAAIEAWINAGVPFGTNCDCGVSGINCDDNDPCTTNDVYDANCNCAGTFQDSDNDTICDTNDTTTGNCALGATCDDNDPCTTNDVYDSNCNCAGILQMENNPDCEEGGATGPAITDYCTLSGNSTNYEYIEAVQLHTLNNASGNNGGYGLFPDLLTTLSVGEHIIQLTPGFAGGAYSEGWTVWIDLNQDGDFEDNGELLVAEKSPSMITATLTIPATALSGNTWMRIAMNWNSSLTNPCSTISYGEVEDYPVLIGGDSTVDCPDADQDNLCDNEDPCPQDPQNNCQIPVTYCDLSATTSQYEYIQSVVFGDLDNSSGNNNGYGDFTNQQATVSVGQQVAFELTPGFSSSAYDEYWSVWIDFNNDGDFSEEEQVFTATSKQAVVGNITIPSTAKLGSTRMRVAMQWKKAMPACGSYQYGEVEDYSIVISDGVQSFQTTSKSRSRPTLDPSLPSLQEVKIYPNPAIDRVYIEGIHSNQVTSIVLLNGLGQTVMDLSNRSTLTDGFSVQSLPAGLYILHFQQLEGRVVRYLVVE